MKLREVLTVICSFK